MEKIYSQIHSIVEFFPAKLYSTSFCLVFCSFCSSAKMWLNKHNSISLLLPWELWHTSLRIFSRSLNAINVWISPNCSTFSFVSFNSFKWLNYRHFLYAKHHYIKALYIFRYWTVWTEEFDTKNQTTGKKRILHISINCWSHVDVLPEWNMAAEADDR